MRALVVVVLLTGTALAQAQTTDARATAQARRMYDLGITHYDLGEYKQALTAFEDAYRAKRDAALLFNIAQCQRQLAHYEDAARSYRAFLRNSPDAPNRAEVKNLIEQMDAAAQQQRASAPPTGTQPMGSASHPPVPAAHSDFETASSFAVDQRHRPATRGAAIAAIGLLGGAVVCAGIASGLVGHAAGLDSKTPTSLNDLDDLTNRASAERSAAWALYAVGGAALVGAAVSFGVWAYRRSHGRSASANFTPTPAGFAIAWGSR